MGNTIASKVYRDKYRSKSFQLALRNALVAEKICEVDRGDAKTIQNPYGSTPTITVQALAGTYSVADYTTNDDTLTVADEFIVAEHIPHFESMLADFDLFAARHDEMNYALAAAIDSFVLNNLCEDGTGTYSTPSGGFTTAANFNTILANIISKLAGYADFYKGIFLVVENTDLTGIIPAQAANGFSFADLAMRNGLVTNQMGVDIYVVRTGTFADATKGTKTYTNSGHRVAGVKGVSTYAQPRGITFEEKGVTGKTGMEVAGVTYCGFKLWTQKASLIIDITII